MSLHRRHVSLAVRAHARRLSDELRTVLAGATVAALHERQDQPAERAQHEAEQEAAALVTARPADQLADPAADREWQCHPEQHLHDPAERLVLSQWVTGDAHLPADVLPLLVDFVGDEQLVLGAYHRAHHLAAPQVPEEATAERHLAHRMAAIQLELLEARDPTSDEHGDLSATERETLIRQGENLGRELEQYLSALRANVARPRVVAGGRR